MTWTSYLGNAFFIESIYSKAPSLDEIRLHEVRLNQEGTGVSLRLDLNEFPDNPPQKWIYKQFNRVQLTLVLIDIKHFRMNGWCLNNVGNLRIEKLGDGVCAEFTSESVQIACHSQHLEMEKISTYCDSELRE